MAHALVVEDDTDFARLMASLVASSGLTAATAGSLNEARKMIAMSKPDVILLDLDLPDGNGLALLEEASTLGSDVVLMTGYASVESSVRALRQGATDYLVKPIDRLRLQAVLGRYLPLAQDPAHKDGFGPLLGKSPVMQPVFDRIRRVAPTNVSVLLSGESGTGKEVAARAIHYASQRPKGPFIAVNCSALSPQLAESEIFGHERGSFTGAERAHEGFFERANSGTLFLDEITEMPISLQAKLLRVLENGSFLRVGASLERQANARIIAATNRDPWSAVLSGHLREDLYWRLAAFPLNLPPLRERIEDVPLLARRFANAIASREGKEKRFTEDALAALTNHRWPGNVRELRNVVHQSWVMSPNGMMGISNLPELSHVKIEQVNKLDIRAGMSLADAERQLVLATLSHCGGSRDRCSRLLGISLKTLFNKLKLYGQA